MRAVHFGAGNIGRGFIGDLLSDAGYATTAVVMNQACINQRKQQRAYEVICASEHTESIREHHISAINNQTHPEAVQKAIADTDSVRTPIGPSILPKSAPI